MGLSASEIFIIICIFIIIIIIIIVVITMIPFADQMLENLPPAQKQQLPQKLEDCQKRVVVLQRQLEAAQAELQRPQPAEDDATSVKVPTAALTQMRIRVALLEEAEYQMSELEKLNAQLNQNILQLQQGKVRLLIFFYF